MGDRQRKLKETVALASGLGDPPSRDTPSLGVRESVNGEERRGIGAAERYWIWCVCFRVIHYEESTSTKEDDRVHNASPADYGMTHSVCLDDPRKMLRKVGTMWSLLGGWCFDRNAICYG